MFWMSDAAQHCNILKHLELTRRDPVPPEQHHVGDESLPRIFAQFTRRTFDGDHVLDLRVREQEQFSGAKPRVSARRVISEIDGLRCPFSMYAIWLFFIP